MLEPQYPWHIWPGRHWPATAVEEKVFIDELKDLSADFPTPLKSQPQYTRGDMTALLNSLRCGSTFQELYSFLPGLNARNMLAAYEHLAERLKESRVAWQRLVKDPSVSTVTHNGPDAIAVLPGIEDPLFRVRVVMGPHHLPEQVAALNELVIENTQAATDKEAELEQTILDGASEQAIELGAQLYNPYRPALWGHPLFLPSRVVSLMPVRVADLLRERRG